MENHKLTCSIVVCLWHSKLHLRLYIGIGASSILVAVCASAKWAFTAFAFGNSFRLNVSPRIQFFLSGVKLRNQRVTPKDMQVKHPCCKSCIRPKKKKIIQIIGTNHGLQNSREKKTKKKNIRDQVLKSCRKNGKMTFLSETEEHKSETHFMILGSIFLR